MVLKDGYLYDIDDVERLPLEAIEDTLLRIHRDSYLSLDTKCELMDIYLTERKHKLDHQFSFTDENIERIKAANELIKKASIRAIDLAWQTYQRFLAKKRAQPDGFVDVEISPQLVIPNNLYDDYKTEIYTDREEKVWGALCSSYNKNLSTFHPLHSFMGYSTIDGDGFHENKSAEEVVKECVCNYDEEHPNWGDAWILCPEKLESIIFVCPFHNLFDYCQFAMSDILKIKHYGIKIEIKDENI